MTRYLLCADIHGRMGNFVKAFRANTDVKAVFVAGDLQLDSYEISDYVNSKSKADAEVVMVQGNCDAYEPSAGLLRLDQITDLPFGHKALLTHGHKYGSARLDLMSYKAEECGCDIVIFGHIHRFVDEEYGGIRFINPGALNAGNYAILIIDDDGRITVERKTV